MIREFIGLGCITTAQLQLAMMFILLGETCQTPQSQCKSEFHLAALLTNQAKI